MEPYRDLFRICSTWMITVVNNCQLDDRRVDRRLVSWYHNATGRRQRSLFWSIKGRHDGRTIGEHNECPSISTYHTPIWSVSSLRIFLRNDVQMGARQLQAFHFRIVKSNHQHWNFLCLTVTEDNCSEFFLLLVTTIHVNPNSNWCKTDWI